MTPPPPIPLKTKIFLFVLMIGGAGLIALLTPHKDTFFHGYSWMSEGDVFAHYHSFDDFNDPNFFNNFFFPGYEDCNNMTEYILWRQDNPNYSPPEPFCFQCHDAQDNNLW